MSASDPAVSLTWRLRGTVPSIDSFVGLLWQNVDAQFLICRKDSGERCGLVQLYGYVHRDGVASLSAFLAPPYQRTGWPIEGLLLFLNYCFSAWPLRKIYFESVEEAFEGYGSGLGSYFEIEGRLREYEFVNGRFSDRIIAAMSRQSWLDRRDEISTILGTTGRL